MAAASAVTLGEDLIRILNQLDNNFFVWNKIFIGIGSTLAATCILALRRHYNAVDQYHKSRYQRPTDFVAHYGSCLCEKVHFKVTASRNLHAVDIPSKMRFPRVSVPYTDFELLCDERILSIFSKNSRQASYSGMHVFCSFCGVHILHSPSDNPVFIQVNADCLDSSLIQSIDVCYHSPGEELSSLPIENSNSSRVQDRRGVGFLFLKDNYASRADNDADILEDDNPYAQYIDNESESTASSNTTLTYDYTPSQKLMQQLQYGCEKTPLTHTTNNPLVSSSSNGNRYNKTINHNSIPTCPGVKYVSPMREDSSLSSRERTPPTQYEEIFRHPSSRRQNQYLPHQQPVSDWSRGANYVYNSIYNDGVVKEAERRRVSSNSSTSLLLGKPPAYDFSGAVPGSLQTDLGTPGGSFDIGDDMASVHSSSHSISQSSQFPAPPSSAMSSLTGPNVGTDFGSLSTDPNVINRLRKHLK